MAGIEVIAPSGSYDRDRPVNAGRNAWQLAALYGVTWLPGAWETSAACASPSIVAIAPPITVQATN